MKPQNHTRALLKSQAADRRWQQIRAQGGNRRRAWHWRREAIAWGMRANQLARRVVFTYSMPGPGRRGRSGLGFPGLAAGPAAAAAGPGRRPGIF